ncbi:ECF transporter S component [Bacillus infantis]|uniref:ECF transporter S component n=1 Tax=Bacillus infantis TaxID=324767 RepID=UPI003CF765E2
MKNKKMMLAALFIAFSAIGAAVKIPAVIGSVALDSFPALAAAALLGGGSGSIVAGLGHLLSALVGGMPLGPLHFLVAAEMAVLVWVYGKLWGSGRRKMAFAIFAAGNTFAAPLPFLFLMGTGFYIAIVPSLLIGSLLNGLLAFWAVPRISRVLGERQREGNVPE